MNKILKISGFLSFISLIGIAWCYHKGATAMQGFWSGAFMASMLIYIETNNKLLNEEEEEE